MVRQTLNLLTKWGLKLNFEVGNSVGFSRGETQVSRLRLVVWGSESSKPCSGCAAGAEGRLP